MVTHTAASLCIAQSPPLTALLLLPCAAGAFFLAYAAGQIPSNFLLLRFGGPVWLACICVAWGIAASCMAFVRGPVSFVLLRMLLGLAESGAFPGTW
jgi:MFS family permease